MEINWIGLAELTYNAYISTLVANGTLREKASPTFAELPEVSVEAWVAAAKTAGQSLTAAIMA